MPIVVRPEDIKLPKRKLKKVLEVLKKELNL